MSSEVFAENETIEVIKSAKQIKKWIFLRFLKIARMLKQSTLDVELLDVRRFTDRMQINCSGDSNIELVQDPNNKKCAL